MGGVVFGRNLFDTFQEGPSFLEEKTKVLKTFESLEGWERLQNEGFYYDFNLGVTQNP